MGKAGSGSTLGTKGVGARSDPLSSDLRLASPSDGAARLAAPPADGAANEELVSLLSRVLGVARREVTIVRGHGSRTKLVELRGLQPDEIRLRLTTSSSE